MSSGRWVAVSVIVAVMAVVLLGIALSISSVDWRSWSFAWGPESAFDVERTIQVAGGDSLFIDNPIGAVTLRGGGSPGVVEVSAAIRLRGPDASREDAEQSLQVTEAGSRKRVEMSGEDWWTGLFQFGRGGRGDITVVVPDGLPLEIDSATGRIVVRDVKGSLSIDNSVGVATVEGFEGRLAVETQTGVITVRDAVLDGPLSLDSQTGAVSFSGVPGPQTTIHSSTGAITLYLPEDRAYELEVDTSRVGEQFDTELPYSRGCIGSGDVVGQITIRTAVGAVHIRAGVR